MNTTFLSALLLVTPAAAAEKGPTIDTSYLRDHAETRGFMLGRPAKPKITPDGKAVLFLRAQARVAKLRLYEFDIATGKTRELLTPEMVLKGVEESLTPEEKARRERQRVSVGGFTDFQLSDDGKRILVSLSGKLYVVDRANSSVQALKTGAGTILDPKFAPGGASVAYVRDHDLYVLDIAANQERRITTGGSDKLTHGEAEFVAQEEMGRFTGYWWSPDHEFLAYEEVDATGVEVWYVGDPMRPEQPATAFFYPRPGKANVNVRLGITPVRGGATVWMRWDVSKYPYLTDVRWDKRGPLTIGVQTRRQDELVLLRVNPMTGATTPLITDRDSAWINLRHDCPRWLDNGSFLWVADRDGGPRLELHSATGELTRVLVDARVGFHSLIDINPKTGEYVYRASLDPTAGYLFRGNLDTDKSVPLTPERGQHGAVFGEQHDIWVHQFSGLESMPVASVCRHDGSVIGVLPSVAEEPPAKPRAELLQVGTGEGFHAVVIRPSNFDSARRYPTILHVYGGPTAQQVTASMASRLLDQWIADQGFMVASLDNRGTPGRGHDWERAVRKHFGSVPLDDQVAGLRALGERFPEMDLQRVGIYGWSFGGYLSALAVLRRPDVFAVAVAGAPVVAWEDYDTHYTERYLGLPDTDADAYREGSLLTYAKNLSRPLLLVHGTSDDNVYFRHTLRLTDALFKAGKDFEVLPLSGFTHMVPDPLVTQRLYARIVGQFQKHLGMPTAGAR